MPGRYAPRGSSQGRALSSAGATGAGAAATGGGGLPGRRAGRGRRCRAWRTRTPGGSARSAARCTAARRSAGWSALSATKLATACSAGVRLAQPKPGRARGPRPLCPPGKRHGLPGSPPLSSADRLPGPRSSRHTGRAGTGRTPGPAARGRTGRKYSAGGARPWPSVKQPTVRTDRPGGPDSVRYTSVDTATHRPEVTHPDTWRDKNKTARRARFRSQRAVHAGGGRCWVRTNVG